MSGTTQGGKKAAATRERNGSGQQRGASKKGQGSQGRSAKGRR
jgi:hypothetical protein